MCVGGGDSLRKVYNFGGFTSEIVGSILAADT